MLIKQLSRKVNELSESNQKYENKIKNDGVQMEKLSRNMNALTEENEMYGELITNSTRELKLLKKEVKRLSTKKYREGLIRDCLANAGITNKGEQNCYINPGQKSFHYDDEHIARAVVIRGISPQAYNNLRRQSHISF